MTSLAESGWAHLGGGRWQRTEGAYTCIATTEQALALQRELDDLYERGNEYARRALVWKERAEELQATRS